MHLTSKEIKKLQFQPFYKTALVQARPLTEKDYAQKNGIIHTQEGPVGFQPGDYLARGIEGEEWPITKESFVAGYERVTEADREGFASYRAVGIREAHQMPEEFTVSLKSDDILTGKAGDYLVRSEEKIWIADREIFENSYERLP